MLESIWEYPSISPLVMFEFDLHEVTWHPGVTDILVEYLQTAPSATSLRNPYIIV